MWTVVYMSQTFEEAQKIRKLLEDRDIIVKNKRVNNSEADECYFEILVPSKEVPQAHSLIIDAEL